MTMVLKFIKNYATIKKIHNKSRGKQSDKGT